MFHIRVERLLQKEIHAVFYTAVVMLEAVAPRQPTDLDLQLHLWRAYSYQVDGFRFTNRYQRGLNLLQDKGLGYLDSLAQRWPNQPRIMYGLHVCHYFLSIMHHALGATEQSVVENQASIRYAEAMVAADPANQKGHEAVARAYLRLGHIYRDRGQTESSIGAFEKTISTQRMLSVENPENTDFGAMLAGSQRALCTLLLATGQLTDALQACLASQALQEKTVAVSPQNNVQRTSLGSVYGYLARIHRALGAEAPIGPSQAAAWREALAWYAKGTQSLQEARQRVGRTEIDWEVHPDTLAAEEEALLLRMQQRGYSLSDAQPR